MRTTPYMKEVADVSPFFFLSVFTKHSHVEPERFLWRKWCFLGLFGRKKQR